MPERYLSLLRPGMAVTATSSAWPDQSFSGVLETLDSRISSDTQNIKARVILPNTGGQLRPGMLMNVDLSLPPQKMTLIPPSRWSTPASSASSIAWRRTDG